MTYGPVEQRRGFICTFFRRLGLMVVPVATLTSGLETVVRGKGVELVSALGIAFDVAKLAYASPNPAAIFLLPETPTPEATLVVPDCAPTRGLFRNEVAGVVCTPDGVCCFGTDTVTCCFLLLRQAFLSLLLGWKVSPLGGSLGLHRAAVGADVSVGLTLGLLFGFVGKQPSMQAAGTPLLGTAAGLLVTTDVL